MGAYIPWNDSEANLKKNAQIYNEFMYDNTGDNVVSTIANIKKIVKKLDDECSDLNIYLSRLSNTYGSVSTYDGTIDDIKRDISNSMNELDNKNKKLMNDFSLALIELTAKDSSLFDDLQKISSTLYRGN